MYHWSASYSTPWDQSTQHTAHRKQRPSSGSSASEWMVERERLHGDPFEGSIQQRTAVCRQRRGAHHRGVEQPQGDSVEAWGG